MAVRSKRLGPVTVVTLSRPEVRNAVDADTARALYDAFVAFDEDPEAKVAVFHGAHGHFCAGWDLQYGARMAKADGAQAGGAQASAQDFARALDFDPQDPRARGPMGPTRLLLGKPVIAAVAGAAVAGGLELALWCDLRVVERSAYFGVYCRRFGVPLIDGGTVRLPRVVGMGHAMDMILSGRKVEAEEALRMGLANRVVDDGTALETALAWARQLCAFPQATMRADRVNAHLQWGQSLPDALHGEWERSKARIADGLEGAGRFAAGEGRGGRYD